MFDDVRGGFFMIEKEQVLWTVCQEMTKNLKANAICLGERTETEILDLLNMPGIFGVFYKGRELGLGVSRDDELDLIFVDSTENFGRHLLESCTGCSGLRRSLAALLATRYELQAIPRSTHEQDVDRYDNYSLTKESEEKLTQWMKEHLYFSTIAVGIGEEETYVQAMINCNAPVFNLQNNKDNQYGAEIKHCRKILADQARSFVPETV